MPGFRQIRLRVRRRRPCDRERSRASGSVLDESVRDGFRTGPRQRHAAGRPSGHGAGRTLGSQSRRLRPAFGDS
ncbi:hypothetical protein G6F59_018675 [Rhizopus arrhizus]|nr:hypothetical protein G6F59_018675 [Rhizopus arrhizus]